MASQIHAAVRAALPVAVAAEHLGLNPRAHGGHVDLDCAVCGKRTSDGKPAARVFGDRWKCVRCDAKGDVFDLIGIVEGFDSGGALRRACELAGINPADYRDPIPAWKLSERVAALRAADERRRESVRPALKCSAEALVEDVLAARLRALNLAAWHYMTLAPWHLRDHGDPDRDGPTGNDRPTAREHLEYLADMVAPHKVPRLYPVDFPRGAVGVVLERAAVAAAYVRRRLGLGPDADVPEVVRELVGVCPAQVSGLEALLHIHGGAELVQAGVDAGILRRWDGRLIEALAGRIIYVWADARGRAVYLTGRAVEAVGDDGRKRPLWLREDAPKALGLPVFDPERRGDRLGVPRVEAPFGIYHARALAALTQDRSVFVVEGEMDALAALAAGFPAVATGGTGRMDTERGRPLLRAALEGLNPIVSFDADPDPEKRQKADAHSRRLAHAIGETRGRWLPAGSLSDAIHEAHEGPGRGLGTPGILRHQDGPEQGSGACDSGAA